MSYCCKNQYKYAVTPEHVDVARRAALWMAVYFWRRALYKVQYDGMSEEEVRAAIEARAAGYNGGMPPGARISEEAAIERWPQGERAYMIIADPLKRVGESNPYDLSHEPMFVRLDAQMQLTNMDVQLKNKAKEVDGLQVRTQCRELSLLYRELSDTSKMSSTWVPRYHCQRVYLKYTEDVR